jgi:hypothetical protein
MIDETTETGVAKEVVDETKSPLVRRWATSARGSVSKSVASSRQLTMNSVKSWNRDVLEAADGDVKVGTRWGRGASIIVPSFLAIAGIAAAIGNGALAANFNLANQPIDLHINSVTADGMGIVMSSANVKNEDGSMNPTALLHAAIGSGQIDGICMIAKQSILGATYSVILSVPPGLPELTTGANVQFDVTDLVAHDIKITNAFIGKSADDLEVSGQNLGGQPGGFGFDAGNGTAVLNDVSGTARGASILGSLEAPVFNASIKPGEVTSC